MTDFTLTIPQNVVQRAQNIANETSQPVENILLDQLQLWAETVPSLSSEEEAELQALKYLSDDALWTIAREQMPEPTQAECKYLWINTI